MGDVSLVILVLAGGTWLAGILGAVAVAFIRRESWVTTRLIPGFAAGVILMVSFVELLHPAIHLAEGSPLPAWIVVPVAFAVGFFCALLLDIYIAKTARFKYKQGVILLGALSAHSVPEGLALGVLLGALGRGFDMGAFWAVVPIFLAVGLHKFPEGAAVSVAFHADGMSKLRSFLFGQASGFIAFLAGVLGFVIAINVSLILPYAMGFAGGAMIWVAVHELIPKAAATQPLFTDDMQGEGSLRLEASCNHRNGGSSYLSAVGVFCGVVLMLFIDSTLHDHKNVHGHTCSGHQCHVCSHENDIRMWVLPNNFEGRQLICLEQ